MVGLKFRKRLPIINYPDGYTGYHQGLIQQWKKGKKFAGQFDDWDIFGRNQPMRSISLEVSAGIGVQIFCAKSGPSTSAVGSQTIERPSYGAKDR